VTRAHRRLVWVSVAASLWFAFWFFGVFPAAVLYFIGADLVPPAGPDRWLGGGISLAALAGVAVQVAAFVRVGRGTHAPFAPPEQLVQGSLYRHSRNPMYLLYVTVVLGEAVAWRSLALAAYAAVFFVAIHFYIVRVEEPALARRFGDAWQRYAAAVPRYVSWRRASTQ
jgi:protein-S-isoprenylcysteine O-methyltransferase Ste14